MMWGPMVRIFCRHLQGAASRMPLTLYGGTIAAEDYGALPGGVARGRTTAPLALG